MHSDYQMLKWGSKIDKTVKLHIVRISDRLYIDGFIEINVAMSNDVQKYDAHWYSSNLAKRQIFNNQRNYFLAQTYCTCSGIELTRKRPNKGVHCAT